MRKFIIGVLCIILAFSTSCWETKAQIVKEGKTFVSQQKSVSSDDIATDYQWEDSKGNTYPIFLHKYTKGENNGKWGAYVKRVSLKTGKEYKYYIPEGLEIAEQIVKEMGLK